MALKLWEGYRGMEEYAREVFPLEEAANGLKWMEDDVDGESSSGGGTLENGDGNVNGNVNDLAIRLKAVAEMDQENVREGKAIRGTTGGGITTLSQFGGSC